MNRYLLIGIATILSCNQPTPKETKVDTVVSPPAVIKQEPLPEDQERQVSGDFNGDGKTEFAYAIRVKEGEGNPVEDGTPDEYAIRFSDTTIAPIRIGCCEARLINEGDLNHDDADELSAFQAPMNGNTYQMSTYTFKGNRWNTLFEPFLIPTGGDYIPDNDLKDRVFMEQDTVYMYDVDFSDEAFKLVRKVAHVK